MTREPNSTEHAGDIAIDLQRAAESLRQAQETFDQRKAHVERWFKMRLTMGWVAVILLPTIFIVTTYIVFNDEQFPAAAVSAASGALFLDVLGIVVFVWRVVFSEPPPASLHPTIGGEIRDEEG